MMKRIEHIFEIASRMIMICICAIVALGSARTEYPCKRYFEISNIGILAGAILVCIVIVIFHQKYGKEIHFHSTKKKIIWGSVIFGIIQIYICYNYYFLTGWDVGTIYHAALEIVNNKVNSTVDLQYFSVYPNNIELLGIFIGCLKINKYIGVLDPQNGIMVFLILNSIIMMVAGYCLFNCLKFIWNEKWACIGWGFYIIYIGLSPWVSIPHSDSLGLLFPVLELDLLIKLKQSRTKWLYSILLGIVAGIGYYIKPQTIIMLIAILAWELLKMIVGTAEKTQINKKSIILLMVLCIAGIKCAGFIPEAIVYSFDIELDADQKFGMAHFLMMGMNPDSEGVYSGEDVEFSASFSNEKDRVWGECKIIKQRLKAYGLVEYIKLLGKKVLTTYGDGTFAWGMEGGDGFWNEIIPQKNEGVSKITREFYYGAGKYYDKFMLYMQFLWILILFLQCFAGMKENASEMYIVQLSAIGLLIFELLFEARARYLYTFSPLYILLAVGGLKNIVYKCDVIKKEYLANNSSC